MQENCVVPCVREVMVELYRKWYENFRITSFSWGVNFPQFLKYTHGLGNFILTADCFKGVDCVIMNIFNCVKYYSSW